MENQIRDEQVHIFYRELLYNQHPAASKSIEEIHRSSAEGQLTPSAALGLHQPRLQSSMSPVERMLVAVPGHDPLPVYGRLTMRDSGVNVASLESVNALQTAAAKLASNTESNATSGKRSDSKDGRS